MSTRMPKIIILFASYGDGHYRASKAIEACLQAKGVDEVVLLDLMAKSHPLLNEFTKFVYMRSYKSLSSVYGWLYNSTKELQPGDPLHSLLHSLGVRKLQQIIDQFEPDIVIHTFPQLTMPRLLKRTGKSIPLFNVITDFDLHGRWIHPDVDRYYVATEELKQQIESRGIPAAHIQVTGIPIQPAFSETELELTTAPPQQAPHPLARLEQLHPGKRTVLLMSGAAGVMQDNIHICERLLQEENIQVIAVCGRNSALYNGLRAALGDHPDLYLYGYVNDIATLMKASDCIITKPGGLTLAEALECRLPMFLYRPVPGQERNNAKYLQEKGIARTAYDYKQLTEQVITLLDDEAKLGEIRSKINELRRPKAAELIVNDILDYWQNTAARQEEYSFNL
ncbi:MGDG synthase family glycosyltransferase [Paenibacillus aceti]|uniref:Processive diacylglycerol beta-glucosyltransferase n=1 Tax=Paenibacillus aceti TaxID=1820010 RepID=A0ABQ1VU86_9BACL|nr:glycosyltransferase [Paenibacillus aceti]GGF99342.1 processive diacylglycerol beta-glucosyltransferase [Paenibacillus aceti]